MMRSLWTAASGMAAQQISMDTISNNLANVNTTGYKKETAEFKSLLYQTMQQKSTDNEGNPKPVGIQVGLGVRNSAITSQFTQGTRTETGNQFDFAIEGDGFFMVKLPDGTTGYTRSGSFQMALGTEGLTLATSEGYPVLDSTGNPIVLDDNVTASKITFDQSGNLMYPNDKGVETPMDIQIGLANFNNSAGLEKQSAGILKQTAASGEPRIQGTDPNIKPSKIYNKYLEASNVEAVDEMVGLIVTQRAYELNSKAITASDEMLQQANNLRR